MYETLNSLKLQFSAEYAAFPRQESRDSTWQDETREQCVKKNILLVEPLLLSDGLLDDAYECLESWGCNIVGVYIMFREESFDCASLRNADKIQQRCRTKAIEGQVVLDLR